MDNVVSAKAALLAALIQGKGYGLELIERVRDRTGGLIGLHQGSVYPALRDLEAEGLVKSWEGEPVPERGGRPRRYYELTGEGRRAVAGQTKAIAGLFSLKAVPA